MNNLWVAEATAAMKNWGSPNHQKTIANIADKQQEVVHGN
jgi:hypothetical protein